MNKKEIYDFMNQNSVAVISTVEDDKPHARYVWTVKTDEQGILFHTGKMKDLFKQLSNNENAEFCFSNNDRSVQIRVRGKVKPVEDPGIKKELADKRPFLKDIEAKTGSLDFLSVFRMQECQATVWTFESNLKPKDFISL